MPTILLFATAAEAARVRTSEAPGSTVTAALEDARQALGPASAEVLDRSRVWLDGDQVFHGDRQTCGPHDAVVVLPPVGGGSVVRVTEQPDPGPRVADAMVTLPVVHPPTLTIAQARIELDDPHRHLLLLVADDRLLGTLAREDLDASDDAASPALVRARLTGRTVRADELLEVVHAEMTQDGQRRRAVVDEDGSRLLGLLCLKHHGNGYCTDSGIAARARHPR